MIRIERVPVVEDGSVNGCVIHQHVIGKDGTHTLSMSSAGRAHSKHASLPSGKGLAGQDVFGHTSRSIYTADGHGEDGQEAALATVALVPLLENCVTPLELLRSPSAVVRHIKDIACNHLVDFARSGATFTQMIWTSYRGRRWAVTVNVGDSEALLVYSDKVLVCSIEHTWENLDCYRRYLRHSKIHKPVCYNRWNASDYSLQDPDGGYRPILLYNVSGQRADVHTGNAAWISSLWRRKNRESLRFGTQSVRIPTYPHENWGSCVLVGGRARDQVMSTFGDMEERRQTGVPRNMIHVYIHEIPANKSVVGVVQSDGIANQRTLESCGLHALSCMNAEDYLASIKTQRDDMSVAMCRSLPK